MNQAITNALRLVLVLPVAIFMVAAPVTATIQEESCVEPDIEYPVPCED